MIFSFDVRRARKGDCLLLHYGTTAAPGLMLIDGGPSQVYRPQLKPRLAEIRAARGLGATEQLPVDAIMISHIDDDHIVGILELTGELVEAMDAHRALPLKVGSFWYNAFDDIIGNDPSGLMRAVQTQFGPASIEGEPDTDGLNADAAKILASVAKALRLSDDARKLNFRINPPFSGGLAMAVPGLAVQDLGNGLSLTLAGPMQRELIALQREYDEFLKEQARTGAHPIVASFTDDSVPNLASIVAIAAVADKRILLTGDARGDKILDGLELAGALDAAGRMHVDVLKMPHHGSDRNMKTSFLERITADHYVFSGNGENGNPERATFEMLLEARGEAAAYTIHLTYPIAEIDVDREKDWKREQRRETTRHAADPAVEVRADWSPEANGLVAFFAAHPALAAKVSVVESGRPHVIDLLDPLGF